MEDQATPITIGAFTFYASRKDKQPLNDFALGCLTTLLKCQVHVQKPSSAQELDLSYFDNEGDFIIEPERLEDVYHGAVIPELD